MGKWFISKTKKHTFSWFFKRNINSKPNKFCVISEEATNINCIYFKAVTHDEFIRTNSPAPIQNSAYVWDLKWICVAPQRRLDFRQFMISLNK